MIEHVIDYLPLFNLSPKSTLGNGVALKGAVLGRRRDDASSALGLGQVAAHQRDVVQAAGLKWSAG